MSVEPASELNPSPTEHLQNVPDYPWHPADAKLIFLLLSVEVQEKLSMLISHEDGRRGWMIVCAISARVC